MVRVTVYPDPIIANAPRASVFMFMLHSGLCVMTDGMATGFHPGVRDVSRKLVH